MSRRLCSPLGATARAMSKLKEVKVGCYGADNLCGCRLPKPAASDWLLGQGIKELRKCSSTSVLSEKHRKRNGRRCLGHRHRQL